MDKHTWVDIGSSFLPGEIVAAFLWAQMEEADAINQRRLNIWDGYHAGFVVLKQTEKARRPKVPSECVHNAHMYYLLLPNLQHRTTLIDRLKVKGIHTDLASIRRTPSYAAMRPHSASIGAMYPMDECRR